MVLFRLLARSLKPYTLLLLIAILVTIGQVGCDLVAAMPLKFIPNRNYSGHLKPLKTRKKLVTVEL